MACITAACFLTTQIAATAGPHEEGVAAGQAANPVARGNVTTPGATAVVPGYTTTPPERSYYRQPNLCTDPHRPTLPGAAWRLLLGQHTAPDDRCR